MGIGALAVLTAALAFCSWQPAAGSSQPAPATVRSSAPLAARRAQWDMGDPLPAASRPLPAKPRAQIKLGEEPADPAKEKAAAVTRARDHLVKTLEVREEDVVLESATPATWPNAALGCPEKDRMYAQVVTSGFKVILKARGKKHEVHVAGLRAVICPASAAK